MRQVHGSLKYHAESSELLADFIHQDDYKGTMDAMLSNIYSDTELSEFILFMFFITDSITINKIHGHEFTGKEEKYFNKVMAIEQYLPECIEKIEREGALAKSLHKYEKIVGNA